MSEEIPPGSVYITPKQMWEEIVAVRASVDKLTTLVDPSLRNLRGDISDLQKQHDGLAVKVEALEKQAWSSKWVPALVTAVVAAVLTGSIITLISNTFTTINVQ